MALVADDRPLVLLQLALELSDQVGLPLDCGKGRCVAGGRWGFEKGHELEQAMHQGGEVAVQLVVLLEAARQRVKEHGDLLAELRSGSGRDLAVVAPRDAMVDGGGGRSRLGAVQVLQHANQHEDLDSGGVCGHDLLRLLLEFL